MRILPKVYRLTTSNGQVSEDEYYVFGGTLSMCLSDNTVVEVKYCTDDINKFMYFKNHQTAKRIPALWFALRYNQWKLVWKHSFRRWQRDPAGVSEFDGCDDYQNIQVWDPILKGVRTMCFGPTNPENIPKDGMTDDS